MKKFNATFLASLFRFILCLVLGFNYSLYSQSLKIYDGSFNLSEYSVGKARYTYKEVDFERQYEGSFYFTDGSLKIVGQFHDNLKHGKWSYTKYQKDYEIFGMKFKGYLIVGNANYKNGVKQGAWTYLKTQNGTGKILAKSNATFRNDNLFGPLEYQEWEEERTAIKCSFDSLGSMHGEFRMQYNDGGVRYEELHRYRNDSLIFSLFRNISTGEIICKKEMPHEECGADKIYWCQVFNSWSNFRSFCGMDAKVKFSIFYSFLYGNVQN